MFFIFILSLSSTFSAVREQSVEGILHAKCLNIIKSNCVVPENVHTYPTEGIFFITPPLHPSGNSS